MVLLLLRIMVSPESELKSAHLVERRERERRKGLKVEEGVRGGGKHRNRSLRT